MSASIELLNEKRKARSERARRMWQNPRYRLRRGVADGRGGSFTNPQGYVLRYCPSHCRAHQNGYVLEHLLVWEEAHGIQLEDGAIIHHINGIPSDNRADNLFATSQTEHSSYHWWRKKNEKDPSLDSLMEFRSLCQYKGKIACFLANQDQSRKR